jgi:hypothetical protein
LVYEAGAIRNVLQDKVWNEIIAEEVEVEKTMKIG